MAEALAELATVAADAAANRVLPAGAVASRPERMCQLTVELLTRTGYADDVTVLAAQRRDTPVPPLDLERPAVRDSLAPMREAFTGWLGSFGPVEDDRQSLEMAVSEAVTNAIEHAYPRGTAGPVRLLATVQPNGFLEVNVADRGRWQEPGTADDDRGRGLLVIGQLADEMEVRHPPRDAAEPSGARGTTVTIRHRLRHPAVTLLASAGVRALFEVTGQLAAHQQDLTLIAGPASPARAVLDLVGLPCISDASQVAGVPGATG